MAISQNHCYVKVLNINTKKLKNMKLISMTDFVLEQNYTTTLDISQIDFYDKELSILSKIRNYANFLKQPLKLEMFVSCDEDGNVLEEPKGWKNEDCNVIDCCNICKCEQYQKAKDKVLFENYSVIKQSTYYIVVDSHGRNVWLSWNESKTIESLINEVTEVSLTPNAIKFIFG